MKSRPDFSEPQTMIPAPGEPAPATQEKINAFLEGASEPFEKTTRRHKKELDPKVKVAKFFQIDEQIIKDMTTFAYKERMENNKKVSETDIVETALKRYLKSHLKE